MSSRNDSYKDGQVASFEAFWEAQARDRLSWFKDFHTTLDWRPPYADWFLGGKLNAAYNCLDHQIEAGRGKATALCWVGEPGDTITMSYASLHRHVCQFANVLKNLGIERGDRVMIYLPNIPELVIAMLGCARIGAVHCVVSSHLSIDSLLERLDDASANLLITADGFWRNGQIVPVLEQSALILANASTVDNVIVVRRVGSDIDLNDSRCQWYHELMAGVSPECRPEPLASEDLLFLLYTSGTTGRPKGIMHTTAGYLTQVSQTYEYLFGGRADKEVFWCTFDVASAPGHSYGVYGALLNGACTLLYEGVPNFPEASRLLSIVNDHDVTHLYTSPEMMRLVRDRGVDELARHDLSSLRILATTGSPLQPVMYQWLSQNVGNADCPIIDTWWLTESGAIMMATDTKNIDAGLSSKGRPLPGVTLDVVDQQGSQALNEAGFLTINQPWPAMIRGVWDAPMRYREDYWSGSGGWFNSGDYAQQGDGGGIRLLGHVDDVIVTATGRVAPVELEALLNSHEAVSEAVVVGVPEPAPKTTDKIVGFVTLAVDVEASDELAQELKRFCVEDNTHELPLQTILIAPDLPKTGDGKYMRRLLRDVAAGQAAGDMTALANTELIEAISLRATYPENWYWNKAPFDPGEIVLVDIDGVVADAFERMQGIEKNRDRWPEFFDTADEDDAIAEVVRLLDLLDKDLHIVLLSARPLSSQELTAEWMRRHNVRWDLLVLRATTSMQLPTMYKRVRVRELRDFGFDPRLALDDDRRNVDMYHEEGIPCLYIHSSIHS